jgi:hypothetical protein
MPFFSKVFKSKDGQVKKTNAPVANGNAVKKPQWSDAWVRTRVDPEEVVELLHLCTNELKSRGTWCFVENGPFMLTPQQRLTCPSCSYHFAHRPTLRPLAHSCATSFFLLMIESLCEARPWKTSSA